MSRQGTSVASNAGRAGLAPEWLVVRDWRPNVLITGANATTDVCLASLRPSLEAPVYEWDPDVAPPSTSAMATVLIRGVGALSLEEQQRLLSWLDAAAPRHAQVVSTTALDLFPMVEGGTFISELYYRLNTVRLDAPARAFTCGSGTVREGRDTPTRPR